MCGVHDTNTLKGFETRCCRPCGLSRRAGLDAAGGAQEPPGSLAECEGAVAGCVSPLPRPS